MQSYDGNVVPPAAPPEALGKFWLAIGATIVVGLPGIVLRFAGIHPDPVLGAITFGFAILAAAFLLSWAAETAEMDISQGLALAIIAFIAVLPEYAVDVVLAWREGAQVRAGEIPSGLAVANMTGGNRLLIGIGWPLVFLIFFLRTRLRELIVDRQRSLELAFLAIATLYVIMIPLRHAITLLDTIVLVSLFVMYLFFTSRTEAHETELVGPAKAMGVLSDRPRRTVVVMAFIYSALVIFSSAEPFAESLIHVGERFNISEFFLIQWLAPLASESPEILVASLLAWRGRANVGMGALISSKVNQWTLLIGTLPIAFSIAARQFDLIGGLPLDGRQREEIFLTAAQSAFAIAVFINLRMSAREAVTLFVLFATQLFITQEFVRTLYAAAYTLLCIMLLIIKHKDIRPLATTAWSIMRQRGEPAPAGEASYTGTAGSNGPPRSPDRDPAG
jgi:cation:H+ antiporter